MKKDTLKLQKYEENLLLYYKKFLLKLEKYCFMLVKKKGDSRRLSEVCKSGSGVAVICGIFDILERSGGVRAVSARNVRFILSPSLLQLRAKYCASSSAVFEQSEKTHTGCGQEHHLRGL